MEMNEAKKVLLRTAPTFGLLKISEAAMVAGVNPETLRRRVRRGELAAWGFPRRVALADVLAQFVPKHLREVAGSGGNQGSTER
ncbi:MAG: hypothetical protein JST11_12160 [Acidobacteria bacterium]|nr:hypothetical protein [Acidobacteriota bacterium]